MTAMRSMPNYTFDADLELKDAGLVAASAAATVGGSAQILDLGDAIFSGIVVIDASAIEIASNDEEYDIILQGSNSATFASGIESLAQMNLGATEVRQGGAGDSLAGRYLMPFVNIQADITYRYVRIYTVVAGSIATGINFRARIGKTRAA